MLSSPYVIRIRLPRFHVLLFTVILLASPACGVQFSATFEGTEVFREFALGSDDEVNGEFPSGSEVDVAVTLRQAYPVPLRISCGYENVDITDDERKVAFNERAITVFETTLPANPEYDPPDYEDVEDQVFNFSFSEPEAGDYFIACFTVAAPENGIGRGFTIIDP